MTGTWTPKCTISSGTGDIITTGHITTSSGNIEASTGSVTGRTGSFKTFTVIGEVEKPRIPTAQGIYMGHDQTTTHWGIEVCANDIQYIYFTSPGIDMRGRLQYTVSTAQYEWFSGCSFTGRMVFKYDRLNSKWINYA